jgi:hypothetical protein
MNRHAIVVICVRIVNFKNINMPTSILSQLLVKDGACLLDRKYTEANSSCSILVRYSPLRAKMEKPESNNTAVQHAHI